MFFFLPLLRTEWRRGQGRDALSSEGSRMAYCCVDGAAVATLPELLLQLPLLLLMQRLRYYSLPSLAKEAPLAELIVRPPCSWSWPYATLAVLSTQNRATSSLFANPDREQGGVGGSGLLLLIRGEMREGGVFGAVPWS